MQQELDELLPSGAAGNDVHAQRGDVLRVKLGIAAADADERLRVFTPQAADERAVFAVGHGRDGAGVDDIGVAGGVIRAERVPQRRELPLHGLRLILVYLAS